jgi:hypothetical protein
VPSLPAQEENENMPEPVRAQEEAPGLTDRKRPVNQSRKSGGCGFDEEERGNRLAVDSTRRINVGCAAVSIQARFSGYWVIQSLLLSFL